MHKISLDPAKLISEMTFHRNISSGEVSSSLSKNILFDFNEGTLTLKSVNVFAKAVSTMDIENQGIFYFSVNSEKLYKYLGNTQSGKVNLTFNNNKLTVSSGRSRTTFNSESAAKSVLDFNLVVNDESPITVTSEKLKRLISLGYKFVSNKDTTQFTLRSFFIDTKEQVMKLTSMEPNRCIRATVKDTNIDEQYVGRITVDNRNASSIISALADENVTIASDDKNMSFKSGNRQVFVHKQAINPPDFETIINKVIEISTNKVEFDSTSMLNSLKRLQSVVDRIPVVFAIESDKITLTISDSTQGVDSMVEEVEASTSNDNCSFTLNVKYLIDFLSLTEGKCILNYSINGKPLLFESNELRYIMSPSVVKSN